MLSILQKEFGLIVGPQPEYTCFENGVKHVSLAIHAGLIGVAVVSVHIKQLGVHAYLTDGNRAFSRGLTSQSDVWPELDHNGIVALGCSDITEAMLLSALNVNDPIYRYSEVLKQLERNVPGLRDSVARHLGVS